MFTITLSTLLTAVILFSSYQLSHQGTTNSCNNYTNCVFRHVTDPRTSPIENIMVLLNFSAVPDNLEAQCVYQRARITECRSLHDACPLLTVASRDTTRSYADRFYDPNYVAFIMHVGTYGCSTRNVPLLLHLRSCTNSAFLQPLRAFVIADTANETHMNNIFNSHAPATCNQASKDFLKINVIRYLVRKPLFRS